MTKFKNILVPFEGSQLSYKAFKVGLELAKKLNAKLIILDCINISFAGSLIPGIDIDFESIVLNKLRNKAKIDMEKLEKMAKKKNVKIKSYVIDSPIISKSILSFSKSQKIDLIVMAPHSRSGMSEFFLGSISNAIIHQAVCPVLLVR